MKIEYSSPIECTNIWSWLCHGWDFPSCQKEEDKYHVIRICGFRIFGLSFEYEYESEGQYI